MPRRVSGRERVGFSASRSGANPNDANRRVFDSLLGLKSNQWLAFLVGAMVGAALVAIWARVELEVLRRELGPKRLIYEHEPMEPDE